MNPLLLISLMGAAAMQDSSRLTLTAAVDRALGAHPAIAAARATADVARADVGTAQAAWRPGVSLDGAVSKYQKPTIVWPLHELNLRNPPTFDTEIAQASVGAAYTLYDFGARSAKVRAAEAQRDAADATLGATEQAMVARTVGAYLRVLTARGVLAADDQRVSALTAEAKRARDRLAAGKAARVDTLRAAAELANAMADRVNSGANVEVSERELARLIGADYAALHGAPLASVRLGAALTRADQRVAGDANADVQVATQRASAAVASVGAARATRLPQFQATSAVVDRSNITGKWLAEWQVSLGMSWPIYTGGARESAIARAQAGARAAQAQVRLAKLNADQQVDDARAAYDAATARVAALEASVQQATEVARITALARDVGEGTQTDYLIAESALYRARSTLVQARHAVIGARVELARALGDLNRNWIATSLESQP